MPNHIAALSQQNYLTNQQHFDQAYAAEDVSTLLAKFADFETFFAEALNVDTSWRGLYQRDLAQRLAGRRVFELGCGNGLNALTMAHLGAHVIANDIAPSSRKLIETAARELGLQDRIEVVIGDFAELSVPARSFDFVIGKNLLHHLTHEQEALYLAQAARAIKTDGEARFFEPAINNLVLDQLRWMVPLPDRPARWQSSFAEWKRNDPHPVRDNTTAHYAEVGNTFFNSTQISPLGSLERFCRVIPKTLTWRKNFRAWAHKTDEKLPHAIRLGAARSQLIVYREPKV